MTMMMTTTMSTVRSGSFAAMRVGVNGKLQGSGLMGNDALCVVVRVCACMWASPRALGPCAVVPVQCVQVRCLCVRVLVHYYSNYTSVTAALGGSVVGRLRVLPGG